MRVGFLQFYPELFHEKHNLMKIDEMIKGCEADLLVLPELATSGYAFTKREELASCAAPAYIGRIAERFRNLAKRENCAIITGFAEQSGELFYNSQMLVLPDGTIELYRKTHLFYKEKALFHPGDTGFNVYEFRGAKIGLMICFDWIFPESVRSLALKGAEIICHSANLVLPYCQNAMITRSIENRVFTITSNRVGYETNGDDEFLFTGMSQITNPEGDLLIRASGEEEILKVVEIQPEEAQNKWVTGKNHLFKDRRPNLYSL